MILNKGLQRLWYKSRISVTEIPQIGWWLPSLNASRSRKPRVYKKLHARTAFPMFGQPQKTVISLDAYWAIIREVSPQNGNYYRVEIPTKSRPETKFFRLASQSARF